MASPSDYRKPENAALRTAVSNAKEQFLEAGVSAIEKQGINLDPNLLAVLLQLLGPLIAKIIGGGGSKPPITPPSPIDPPPVIPPVTPPSSTYVKCVGGKLRLTGITKNGPLGPRVNPGPVLAGANGPKDSRFEFDFSPLFADGTIGQPNDADGKVAALPDCPLGPEDDPPMQKFRLRFQADGDLERADLAHEYAENGCVPRARVIASTNGSGRIFGIFMQGADGVSVPLTDANGHIVTELRVSDI